MSDESDHDTIYWSLMRNKWTHVPGPPPRAPTFSGHTPTDAGRALAIDEFLATCVCVCTPRVQFLPLRQKSADRNSA